MTFIETLCEIKECRSCGGEGYADNEEIVCGRCHGTGVLPWLSGEPTELLAACPNCGSTWGSMYTVIGGVEIRCASTGCKFKIVKEKT